MPLSRRALLRQSITFAPLVPGALASPIFANSPTETSSDQWYWYPGHALCFKAIAKDTGGTCTWILVENAPREGVPFHKHLHEDESFYVVDGLFEITVGDSSISGGPGTYAYGPRNVPHRWTNVGSSRGRLLNVFTPSGIEQYFLSVAIAVASPSQQPTVDMVELNQRMAPLREKYGIIRTGPTKYPRAGDPSVSAPGPK